MKQLFFSLVLTAFALGPVAVQAQTVTVSKSGTPDFSTVQAAINSFATSDVVELPNVINILDSSVYNETITVNIPVTIQGTSGSGNRPVLAVKNNTGSDGIYVNVTTAATTNPVYLKNLIIIPSKTTPPTDDGINTAGTNVYLELDNCLVTANNGSDAPLTLDGLTTKSTVGATFFGDDLISCGAGVTGTFELAMYNSILSYSNPTGSGHDGLVCASSAQSYNIYDGCVFSFCSRLGVQATGIFKIDAPTTKTIVAYNTGFAGIWFSAAGPSTRSINGAIVAYNGASVASGWGIEDQNGAPDGFQLSNSIIARNASNGLRISEVGNTFPIDISNTTFADNGANPIIVTSSTVTAAITLVNTIVAGNGTSDSLNTIEHDGTGPINLIGTAIVTTGPEALDQPTSGPGTVVGSPSTTADPQFVNTTNPASPSFYDVGNSAYADKNALGGPLSGGADYTPVAAVADWAMY